MREYKIRDGEILEFRDGVEFRRVDPDQQGYVAWLAVGNTPEVLPPLPGSPPPSAADVARSELAALDPVLPRCVEDVVAALDCETSLPAIMQTRLARKRELRAIIAGGA